MTVRSVRKHVLCVAESWNSGSKLSGCMLLSSPRFAFKGKHSPYYTSTSTILWKKKTYYTPTYNYCCRPRGTFTLVNSKTNKCLISTILYVPIYYRFINYTYLLKDYLLSRYLGKYKLVTTYLHSTSYKNAHMID